MRAPSSKALIQAFDLSAQEANLIRRLAHAAGQPATLRALIERSCPETANYVRSLYNDPYDSHMWRVTVVLHAIDHILNGHGVESLGPYEYINMGDAYAQTLIYKRSSDSLRIAEKHPNWD